MKLDEANMTILTAIWSTPRRKIITSITSVLAFFAALGGAVKAWPDLEPLAPAQRYYVIQKVAEYRQSVQPVLKQLQISDYNRDLRALDAEQAQWAIKLPSEQDTQVRDMIKDRLRAIDNEKLGIQKSIDKLQ